MNASVEKQKNERVEIRTVNNLPMHLLLAIHALVWAFSAWLSTNNLDQTGDMVENYVWGIEWQAGYTKHPPLFAWITAAWFSVFPHQDWAYYLLSAINAAIGLLGVKALACRFVARDTAALATLALALSPLYTTLAMKFNADAILLSTWPWTAYFFVVFMQSGNLRYAWAGGAAAGLAMLGKYFSGVLILALILAALAQSSWRQRMWSKGLGVAIAAFGLVMLPHVLWMVDHQFSTLAYASQRSAGTLVQAGLRFIKFTIAQIFYLLPSFGFVLLMVNRGQRKKAASLMACSVFRPAAQPALWWLSFAPLFVEAIIVVTLSAPLSSGWSMPQWFAVCTLWFALLHKNTIGYAPERALRVMGIYWALVLIISVVMGFDGARRGSDRSVAPHAELAEAAQSLWHQQTGRPLTLVGGSLLEASSIAFYSRDATHLWNFTDPVSKLHREGGLLVCPEADAECREKVYRLTQNPAVATHVNKRAWGRELPTRRYELYVIAPGKS